MDVAALSSNSSLLVGLLIVLLVLNIWYTCVYKPYQYFNKAGIPGPTPKPVIGNLDLLIKSKGNVYEVSEDLIKQYGPVCGMYLGQTKIVIVSDLELLKSILIKNFDKFVDRFDIPLVRVFVRGKERQHIFGSKGEDWRRRRHILSPAFTTHKIKLMSPIVQQSITSLLKKIDSLAKAGEPVDALNLYSKMTMEVILATAFGTSVDIQNGKGGKVHESATKMLNSLLPNPAQSRVPLRLQRFIALALPCTRPILSYVQSHSKEAESMDYLVNVCMQMIKSKSQLNGENQRKDLLQLMIDANNDERVATGDSLGDGDMVADSVGFLLAGFETTSLVIALTSYMLASHSDIQEKLINEINDLFEENPEMSLYEASLELKYLDMFIQETLRMYSPVPLMFRICVEDCVVNGIPFDKGTQVFLPYQHIHKNSDIWPDPEKFDPERFSQENKAKHHVCAHMPFGAGPRTCIGMRFALMEAKMALIGILSNYRIVLSSETQVPLEVTHGFLIRPKSKILLQYLPHN